VVYKAARDTICNKVAIDIQKHIQISVRLRSGSLLNYNVMYISDFLLYFYASTVKLWSGY